METRYTLSNGEQICCFFWPEFFENDAWRGSVSVTPAKNYKESTTVQVPISCDDGGIYFIYHDEKVYLNNFDYDTVEVMAKRLQECVDKKDRWLVYDDEIWATFIKDSDNLAFVLDMPVYEMVNRQIGIGFTGDTEATVLCVPTERDYTKDRWHYKVTMECESQQLRKLVPARSFYFSDFCSLVKAGHIKMVHKDQFKCEKRQELAQYQANQKKLFERVKNFFGAGTKLENPTLYIGI